MRNWILGGLVLNLGLLVLKKKNWLEINALWILIACTSEAKICIDLEFQQHKLQVLEDRMYNYYVEVDPRYW